MPRPRRPQRRGGLAGTGMPGASWPIWVSGPRSAMMGHGPVDDGRRVHDGTRTQRPDGWAGLRPRERGRDGPDPRLLRRPLGVRTTDLPDPVEPGRSRRRELLTGLLSPGTGSVPGDDHAEAAPGPEEEPQAATPARALSGSPDQALLRARLPRDHAQVRPPRTRGFPAGAARPGPP